MAADAPSNAVTGGPVPDAALAAVLSRATQEAASRRHRVVTLEHLFFALLQNQEIEGLLQRCGADVADMRRELDEFLELLEVVQPRTPMLDQRCLAVLRHLAYRVHGMGRREVHVRDLLIVIREMHEDYAALLMHAAGIERLDLLRVVSHGTKETRLVSTATDRAVVRLHNDDYTPMVFVVNVLCTVFRMTGQDAMERMLEVHRSGSSVVKITSVEIAVERAEQVLELAEAAGHPLRCTVEPD